jgi:hypothetical protein
MAHHLARLVYRMLRNGQNYVEKGIHQYELKFRLQRINGSKRKLAHLTWNSLPLSSFHHQFLEGVVADRQQLSNLHCTLSGSQSHPIVFIRLKKTEKLWSSRACSSLFGRGP